MNKTISEMQIISNIAKMREKISGVKMDFNRLNKYDVYSMSYNQLFELQMHLLPYYNKAINNNLKTI